MAQGKTYKGKEKSPFTVKGDPAKIGKSTAPKSAGGPMKDVPSPARIPMDRTNTPLRKPDNIIQQPGAPPYKNPGFDEDPKIKAPGERPVKMMAQRPDPGYGPSTEGGVPTTSGPGFESPSQNPRRVGLPATKKPLTDTDQTGSAGSAPGAGQRPPGR
jgi:hypothetical protein